MSTSVLEKPLPVTPESPVEGSATLSSLVLAVIRERMAAQGLSRYRLIKVTGVKEARAYRWLRGDAPITFDELLLVALALGMDAASVMTEAERRYNEAAAR